MPSTAWAVQQRAPLVVNAADFGATGDGVTDDTAALNAAIAGLRGGKGAVFVPAGTYRVTAGLTKLLDAQNIVGAGMDATIIQSATATFDIVTMGNRQSDGIMRNRMGLMNLTVNHAGGASSFSCVVIDGGGNGTHIYNVSTNQGQYGFRLTDLDRCHFWNLEASNQRSAGIRCEVGKENTYGTCIFAGCSVAISDNNAIGWQFAANADQASPNPFDRISIHSTLFFMTTAVTGAVGLQIDNPGATSFALYGCLFEQNITQVKLNKFTQIAFHSCTFLDANVACVDIIQMNTDNHTVSVYDCVFQQATNVFHTISGFPTVAAYGSNKNNGNLTNIVNGSFSLKTGTDTVFMGGANIDLGTSNQRYLHVMMLQLNTSESGVQNLSNGSTITTFQNGVCRCAETANVTGIILASGNDGGENIIVRNESNFTITFDVAGTSHVAGGTSIVIPALSSRLFSWSSANNLWY